MRLRTWLVLIATLLLWSGNWIVARAVREEISPGLATVGRLIVVLAILAPFAWRGLAAKLPALGRREWLIIAGLGLTGGGPHLGLQWLGLHYTTAASGILYLSTTPIFILLLTAALGERMVARQWGGVAISFAGVFLIATQGHPERLSFNRGDLMAIGSLVLAYAGWSYVVAHLGAARAGVTLHLMPAFGVLLSMLFLGEYPHWFHFAGMALILAGVFTASYFGNPAASSSRP